MMNKQTPVYTLGFHSVLFNLFLFIFLLIHFLSIFYIKTQLSSLHRGCQVIDSRDGKMGMIGDLIYNLTHLGSRSELDVGVCHSLRNGPMGMSLVTGEL